MFYRGRKVREFYKSYWKNGQLLRFYMQDKKSHRVAYITVKHVSEEPRRDLAIRSD
jgi:hypothetical protein